MKFIVMADWHLRSGTPAIRTDDFFAAQLKKVEQVLKIATENNADLIIPGDLFDSVRVGYYLLNEVMDRFRTFIGEIYISSGNHDCANHHSDLTPSPLRTLSYLKNVTLLDDSKQTLYPQLNDIVLTGAGWEQEPPKPKPDADVNILVLHVPVYEKSVPFWMEDRAHTPKTLKKKYPGFDWYLTGDIHEPFVKDGVINSGPLLRDNVNHIDYKPRCYLLDTDAGTAEPIFIDVDEDVFVSSHVEDVDSSAYAEQLHELIKSMKMTKEVPKYDQICLDLAKSDEAVYNILQETFNENR